jgi:hypothetical protein
MDIALGIKMMLPDHYKVQEIGTTKGGSGLRCISTKGMDEETFDRFFDEVKNWLGKSFQEVYHATNYMHKDFTVYYKQ